jgi:hypothetical protein
MLVGDLYSLTLSELGVMAVQNSRHVGGSKRCNRCIGENLHSGGRSRPSRRPSIISAALFVLPAVHSSPSSANPRFPADIRRDNFALV